MKIYTINIINNNTTNNIYMKGTINKILEIIKKDKYYNNNELFIKYWQKAIINDLWIEDKDEIIDYYNKQIAKDCHTQNTKYYHYSKDKKNVLANWYDTSKMEQVGVWYGLYLWRDKEALDNFYWWLHRENTFKEHNWGIIQYILSDDVSFLDFSNHPDLLNQYQAVIKEIWRDIEEVTWELGYDWIRYYDALATWEEFVLYNFNKIKNIT